jgi:hypothetical protein
MMRRPVVPSAVGELVVARGPVENAVPVPAAFRRPYTGPQLSLAPRIWHVLEPVKPLLAGLSPYVVREAAREIGRQLDAGTDRETLRTRLEFRFASTETIRDGGRWLLGPALRPPAPRRSGCGLADCEAGFMRYTGAPCKACTELADARQAHPPPATVGRPG